MDKEKVGELKSFSNYYIMVVILEEALGGIMIMWKHSLFLGTFLNANKHFMVVNIKSIALNKEWYIVNVYAPNIKNSTKILWNTLSNIKSNDYYVGWIFLGDFNFFSL